MKSDEAIAPVVAGLLILAVIVTVMSVYFTTYVPSLKEEAEIEHLSSVEREFLSFSSDIENAVWQKTQGRLSRNIELGGGDVFLSSIKSGGVLEVSSDSDLFGLSNTTKNMKKISLVKFSYTPLSNFWQNQGYSWQFGYVNLSTGYGKQTPLLYADMNDVQDEISNSTGLFSSLFDIKYDSEPVFEKNAEGNYTGSKHINCSEISITVTGFKKGDKNYASGNGIAALTISTEIKSHSFNETMVNFTVYDDVSMKVNTTIWKNINMKLLELKDKNFKNADVLCYEDEETNSGKDLGISFKDPVKVNIREISLIISAQ